MPLTPSCRFFTLLFLTFAANTVAINTLSVSACADPATVTRPCTTFEVRQNLQMLSDHSCHATVTPAAQVHVDTCLCPGKGNVVRYTLEISLISVPNVPGAQTKMKTLIGVNGSSPGPTLTATENDWVGKCMT